MSIPAPGGRRRTPGPLAGRDGIPGVRRLVGVCGARGGETRLGGRTRHARAPAAPRLPGGDGATRRVPQIQRLPGIPRPVIGVLRTRAARAVAVPRPRLRPRRAARVPRLLRVRRARRGKARLGGRTRHARAPAAPRLPGGDGATRRVPQIQRLPGIPRPVIGVLRTGAAGATGVGRALGRIPRLRRRRRAARARRLPVLHRVPEVARLPRLRVRLPRRVPRPRGLGGCPRVDLVHSLSSAPAPRPPCARPAPLTREPYPASGALVSAERAGRRFPCCIRAQHLLRALSAPVPAPQVGPVRRAARPSAPPRR